MFRKTTLLLCSFAILSACDVEPEVEDRSLELGEIALSDDASDPGDELDRPSSGDLETEPGAIDPNLAEAGLCSKDETSVGIGDNNELFVAVSRDVVEFDADAWLTLDPEGRTVYAKKANHGITIECRCDSGCDSGGASCQVSMGGHDATCSGTCNGGVSTDGKPCGGCSWHYEGDAKPQPTGPTAPTTPTVPTVPTLPAYPW